MDLILNWLQIIFQRMHWNSNLSNMKEKNIIMSHDMSICSKPIIEQFAPLISGNNCANLLVWNLFYSIPLSVSQVSNTWSVGQIWPTSLCYLARHFVPSRWQRWASCPQAPASALVSRAVYVTRVALQEQETGVGVSLTPPIYAIDEDIKQ